MILEIPRHFNNFAAEAPLEEHMTDFSGPWMVLGAKGMLGTDLTQALRGDGIDTVGLDLDDIDIAQADQVMETIETFRPGIVLNTAALTDVDGCETRVEEAFDVNAGGPENLARACARTGAFLVHISTDYVFDGRKGSPYLEDEPINPLGVYGGSKAEGEVRVRQHLPQGHCIVRTQWLFGLNGKNFVEAILGQAQKRDVLRVVDDQYGCPTFTKDLSTALIMLCRKAAVGTFNVTNSGVTNWHAFACRILDVAGIAGVRVEPMTSAELARPAPRPAYSVLDNTKFSGVTGHVPRPWQEALAEYITRRNELHRA